MYSMDKDRLILLLYWLASKDFGRNIKKNKEKTPSKLAITYATKVEHK